MVALAPGPDDKALLVLSAVYRLSTDDPRIRLLASFPGGIVPDEDFRLYLYEASATGDQARE